MENDQEQITQPTENIESTEPREEVKKNNKRFGGLSKKNLLRTANVKKVVGGAKEPGGGWDHNHNEIIL